MILSKRTLGKHEKTKKRWISAKLFHLWFFLSLFPRFCRARRRFWVVLILCTTITTAMIMKTPTPEKIAKRLFLLKEGVAIFWVTFLTRFSGELTTVIPCVLCGITSETVGSAWFNLTTSFDTCKLKSLSFRTVSYKSFAPIWLPNREQSQKKHHFPLTRA